jgi:hypothetical protein
MNCLSLSLMLRPTISRPVCLGIKHPSGAYDQLFITVRQLLVCWCGALSPTRGRVCRLQLLLVLASVVILGSESSRTRDHILRSPIQGFPFRRLLRLAGLRWRYSTPPSHGQLLLAYRYMASGRTTVQKTPLLYSWPRMCCRSCLAVGLCVTLCFSVWFVVVSFRCNKWRIL